MFVHELIRFWEINPVSIVTLWAVGGWFKINYAHWGLKLNIFQGLLRAVM